MKARLQKLCAWLLSFSIMAGCTLTGCRQQDSSSSEDSQSLTFDDETKDTTENITSNTAINTGSNVISIDSSNSESETNSIVTNANLTPVFTTTPANGTYSTELKPTFTWKGADGAASYILVVEKYQQDNDEFVQVLNQQNITDTSFTPANNLEGNDIYRWKVYAVSGSTNSQSAFNGMSANGGKVFMTIDSVNHPANIGLNFSFNGSISEEVLNNYLSRSLQLKMFGKDLSLADEYVRFIVSTGAKFVARSYLPWTSNGEEYEYVGKFKSVIDKAHELDPDIIFEASIYETVAKEVNEILIPKEVLEAFGQTVETRYFNYDHMIFQDGTFVNQWGTDVSVPDITQLETQMWIYHRATMFIDLGFESLTMAQVQLVGWNDKDWKCYKKVLDMIREYAKAHARRGYVLINGTRSETTMTRQDYITTDGQLLFDFHNMPVPCSVPEGSTSHVATEDSPQLVNVYDLYSSIPLGGITPSGWTTDNLPYMVALDNCVQYDEKWLNNPKSPGLLWGWDQVAWYCNQPSWYRQKWSGYAFNFFKNVEKSSHFCILGNNGTYAKYIAETGQISWKSQLLPSSTAFYAGGDNDEFGIRQIWIDDRNSR